MRGIRLEEIIRLRDTRRQLFSGAPLPNFLTNLFTLADGIRRLALRESSYRPLYVIGLTSALETFLRDLFVYSYRDRQDAFASYIRSRDIKIALAEILEIQSGEIDWVEYCASTINFQSLVECDRAFGALFEGGSWSKAMADFERSVQVHGRTGLLKTPEDWWPSFDQLLQLRHRVVHDANFRDPIASEFLQHAEANVVVIPQICNILWSEIIHGDHGIFVTDTGVPAIFLIDDLLADWEIAEPEETT